MNKHDDDYWMQQALLLAQQAEQLNEVPVGAIVVKGNDIIAVSYTHLTLPTTPYV